MKRYSHHLILYAAILLSGLGAGNLSWAEGTENGGLESHALSMQLNTYRQEQPVLLTPHWSHTDHAMLLGNEVSELPQGMDLRMNMDRLHFKSSIQQEKGPKGKSPLSGPHDGAATEAVHMAAGIGYQWSLLDKKLSLIPMMGLSYHGKTLDPSSPAASPRDHDTLRRENGLSEWNSWWFGLDLRAQPLPDLSVESSLLFHNAKFSERNAEWGGLSESVVHRSEGEGRVFRLGLRQQLSSSWSAGILYSWQQWMAEKGELPQSLVPADKVKGDLPFSGNIQELNISLSYGF